MNEKSLETLLAVALVAALAPAVVALLPGRGIPQVVVLIFSGILIGPHVLGLTETSAIKLLANVGLGFLFLLAGYELDPSLLREQAGKLAIIGWLVSAALAVAAVGGLTAVGFVRDYVPIGLALTTTALGTLLPILKDNDMLGGQFGRYVLAAGAVGELFPIVAISIFLTRRGELVATVSIVLVCLAGLLLAAAPRLLSQDRIGALIEQGRRATAQTTLRWAIVLLLALLAIANKFGLDVVLGAVIAGIVLRNWTRSTKTDMRPLEDKLDAVGYGLFIPIFFVVSGMTLDIDSIIHNPLRMLAFLGLLIVVRGLPSLVVYRRVLPGRKRAEMTFITATTMPLLIALAEIGLSDGVMLKANAAALVGAGVLSVLIYPLIAVGLHGRGRSTEPAAVAEPEPPQPGLSARLRGLPQAGDPLAHADAHRRGAAAPATPAQLVQQRGGDPGA
jgi:Kef-type K+ transport system membrane component KefB